MKGVRNSLVLAFALVAGSAHADAREDMTLTLSLAGEPVTPQVGFTVGLQLNPTLQIVGGVNFLWFPDLSVRAVGAGARIHILKAAITPMFGGGFSYLSLDGSGLVQGLQESTFLGTLMTGVDWTFDSGLRLAAGFQFHFPIVLNLPFLEVGYAF